MADIKNSTMDNLHTQNGNFMCGVIEGFYGRPWTTEQRKDLFQKLKKWGMDSYVYAPKDDYKHRAYWRELYSVEEADHLTGLVSAARECGIAFYYALSPGLDITYSSSKEVAALKRKLEQVSQFGCTAFALLFDDIEPEMSEADKEVFQSFAHAQVSISNEIFQHLNQPKFLLCPTQYCAARAMPNVQNSEYLNTIGAKLAPEIDIMWTGPKVISRLLTVESIEEVTEVLRRPPVIWDNLHANDYDQKRVFLGPYSGRSPDLIRRLRGVLTNPNCEYGANFVAIHTLAQWSRCNADGRRDLSLNDTVSADIKLETETEDGCVEEAPLTLSPNMYHPKRALRNAINEWLPEFRKKKTVSGLMAKPQQVLVTALVPPVLPSVNTCMSLTTTTMSNASGGPAPVPTTPSSPNQSQGNTLQALADVCGAVGSEGLPVQQSPPVPIMNSLVAGNKVVCLERVGVPPAEPMDCNPTPESSPERTGGMNAPAEEDVPMVESGPSLIPQSMLLPLSPVENQDGEGSGLGHEDLALLCDLFYLPFEHGHQGLQLLQEFHWLKANAHVVTGHTRSSSDESNDPEATEWWIRARRLDEMAASLDQLFTRLAHCNNRELVYDLYPYVWDMRGIVSLLNSYVKWLAAGQVPQMVSTYVQGTCTWFSKGWKEAYMSGDQEPWVFRGGLTADLQRLIPVDSSNDLFVYKAPDMPSGKMYKIRPCMPTDAASVYDVCRRTCSDGMDGSNVFLEMPNLIGDKLVGAFLALSPEFCFAVEECGDDCFDDGTSLHGGRPIMPRRVVGYAVAALDARQFYRRLEIAWLPEMCDKYPRPEKAESGTFTPAEEIIEGLHTWKGDVPEVILAQHPSLIATSILNTVLDQSVAKHLVTILLAALRANGSFGCFTELSVRDKYTMEFYSKLGFVELGRGAREDVIYLGRTY